MANKNHFKRSGLAILIILKAFWKSTVEVAWGICGLILFGGFMLQYGGAPTIVEEMFKLSRFLMDNWHYFWLGMMALIISDNWWRVNELKFAEVSGDEDGR